MTRRATASITAACCRGRCPQRLGDNHTTTGIISAGAPRYADPAPRRHCAGRWLQTKPADAAIQYDERAPRPSNDIGEPCQPHHRPDRASRPLAICATARGPQWPSPSAAGEYLRVKTRLPLFDQPRPRPKPACLAACPRHGQDMQADYAAPGHHHCRQPRSRPACAADAAVRLDAAQAVDHGVQWPSPAVCRA